MEGSKYNLEPERHVVDWSDGVVEYGSTVKKHHSSTPTLHYSKKKKFKRTIQTGNLK